MNPSSNSKLCVVDAVCVVLCTVVGVIWTALRHDPPLVAVGVVLSFALGGFGVSTLILEWRDQ